jgi:hypothetical protein
VYPPKNPYPPWWVRVFAGKGTGTLGNTRGLPVPFTNWCRQGSYTRIMNRTFTADQKWTLKKDYADDGDQMD